MTFQVASFLDHAAFYVRDMAWHISFFREVLGLEIRETAGDPGVPEQVWFHGGVQLIADPGFRGPEGRMGHLGFMVEDLEDTLDKAYARGVTELPQGRNWIRVPDGLCLELLQAREGSVEAFCQVAPR